MSVPAQTEFMDFMMNVCWMKLNKIWYSESLFQILLNDQLLKISGKRRFNIKLWKTFTDCFNCLPMAAIIDEKIFCCHGGLSPDLQSMDQLRKIMRPTDIPDTGRLIALLSNWNVPFKNLIHEFVGLLCDILWSDPDKDVEGWGENDRGISFTFGADVVSKFLNRHNLDLICRGHQV